MKKLLFGLLAFGLTTLAYSQIIPTVELSEVTVYATNYKYLNNVNTEEVASIPVKLLQQKVATYDIKSSEYYQDDYDLYNITFFIPEGKILAAYDKDGKLLRTAEKFKDINLPSTIKSAIADRFPGWTITKDIYVVSYIDPVGAKKTYKLKLENEDKMLRVKLDETGKFL
ncbi:nicotinate-nucleotide adenylyltransferase [Arenibacter sp. N53]|uniref:nicotinate-nucleotide adenylyltransferase n=1 Tax=Arenibacter TaxID=178469 RepID=UPI000CD48E1C|nr:MULTISPECIES: nicotinate-nucleotide adenylyltransferase [Arenibacter]MCM4153447.1 nicotinate-nucleotide adenylyltransferase [Arenibacter sp. N53]